MKELLSEISRAEEQADAIRQKAAEEARGMIQSVEEACAAAARQSQKAARDAAGRLMEETRTSARAEIGRLAAEKGVQRELLRQMAQRRIPRTAAILVERIVSHGNR